MLNCKAQEGDAIFHNYNLRKYVSFLPAMDDYQKIKLRETTKEDT
jgi:hypothetical protein